MYKPQEQQAWTGDVLRWVVTKMGVAGECSRMESWMHPSYSDPSKVRGSAGLPEILAPGFALQSRGREFAVGQIARSRCTILQLP